jgi:hypothetical protein
MVPRRVVASVDAAPASATFSTSLQSQPLHQWQWESRRGTTTTASYPHPSTKSLESICRQLKEPLGPMGGR